MAKTSYQASSPYFDTTQTSWYLLPMAPRNIPADSTDQYMLVTSKYNNRPDLLSYDLYGTSAYWWIFQMRNMDVIRDPIWDMVAGLYIYAPTAQRLQSLLG